MEIALPLEEMSIEEKIQTMEIIWNDPCKKAGGVPSPSWHKNIIEQREERIKKGEDEFVDWNEAKKHIRDKIS